MISNIKKRKRKAYSTAFAIARSYIWLKVLKPFISYQRYGEKLEKKHLKNADKLKDAITELNGLFIKVGQLLSIMSNVLPEAYAIALETLQDHAPASSPKDSEATILNELGRPPTSIFDQFEAEPIAAASIGQVHIAYLTTGEKVAVKIQHPQIERLAKLDLQIIENLVKLAGRYFKVNGLDNIYKQVRIMINEELDYSHEASAMQTIRENLKDQKRVIVPEVFTELSSKKVLVTKFCEGQKIANQELYTNGKLDAQDISEHLMTAYCKMLLVDGYYHADPHPGNILVNQEGEIILLDFGAVGILSDITRKEIPKFLQAIVAKDSERVLTSMQKMGFVSKDKDTEKTAQKMIDAMNEFISSGVNFSEMDYDTIKNSNIDELRKELSFKELTSTFDVPKDWILLQRSLVLLLAIFANIAPKYNPVDTIKPFVKRMVLSKEGFKNLVLDSIVSQATTLLGIPRKVDAFLNKANKGELEIEVKGFEKQMKRRNALSWQIFIGSFAMICFILSFIANQYGNIVYERYFIVSALVLGLIFALLVLRGVFKRF
ncbi:MAG: ABC1 kinase family protein [Crocinitomicaceae bacterium]